MSRLNGELTLGDGLSTTLTGANGACDDRLERAMPTHADGATAARDEPTTWPAAIGSLLAGALSIGSSVAGAWMILPSPITAVLASLALFFAIVFRRILFIRVVGHAGSVITSALVILIGLEMAAIDGQRETQSIRVEPVYQTITDTDVAASRQREMRFFQSLARGEPVDRADIRAFQQRLRDVDGVTAVDGVAGASTRAAAEREYRRLADLPPAEITVKTGEQMMATVPAPATYAEAFAAVSDPDRYVDGSGAIRWPALAIVAIASALAAMIDIAATQYRGLPPLPRRTPAMVRRAHRHAQRVAALKQAKRQRAQIARLTHVNARLSRWARVPVVGRLARHRLERCALERKARSLVAQITDLRERTAAEMADLQAAHGVALEAARREAFEAGRHSVERSDLAHLETALAQERTRIESEWSQVRELREQLAAEKARLVTGLAADAEEDSADDVLPAHPPEGTISLRKMGQDMAKAAQRDGRRSNVVITEVDGAPLRIKLSREMQELLAVLPSDRRSANFALANALVGSGTFANHPNPRSAAAQAAAQITVMHMENSND